jgi:VanZ family protein
MISVKVYRLAFWTLLLAVAILSMISVPAKQIFDWQDKFHHICAYGALFLLLTRAYGQKYGLWLLAVSLALFGLAIEISQSFTTYRQGDLWDMAANIGGIILAWLISACFKPT